MIEKAEEESEYEKKMQELQGVKPEEKEESFFDNLFGFLLGAGDYYEEEKEEELIQDEQDIDLDEIIAEKEIIED